MQNGTYYIGVSGRLQTNILIRVETLVTLPWLNLVCQVFWFGAVVLIMENDFEGFENQFILSESASLVAKHVIKLRQIFVQVEVFDRAID